MSRPDDTISALLPVHAGVQPDHLASALDSLVAQTRPADEIIVVEDGPLSEGHLRLLDDLKRRHPRVLRIALPENQGAGVANQAGLAAASGTWIAKADADDISVPSRFENQLSHLRGTGADVCGGAMLEFEGEIARITARRGAPVNHESIAGRMRSNNPINHPTAMYRRMTAIEAGGYPDMRFMQDYVLFARMLSVGATLVNLSEPLVYFRAGEDLHRRRSARGLLRLEWRLQRELRATGLLRWPRSLMNLAVRCGYRLLPIHLRRLVHRHVLASGRPGKIQT
jgi:glycosyltransferase involved in cell wall biosynthesis